MKQKILKAITNPWVNLAIVGATAIGGFIAEGIAWGIFFSYFVVVSWTNN